MNIFILNSGRCGSTTFIKACQHIENYSAAHESRVGYIGEKRLAYPVDHIEADNRLSWFLGRLDECYSDDAIYIYLQRDPMATRRSFARRDNFGIMQAYRHGLLLGETEHYSAEEIATDYLKTIDANIRHFLKNKSQSMDFYLERAEEDFSKFWQMIGAQGDLGSALMEWQQHYNASEN